MEIPCIELARELLGKILCRRMEGKTMKGMIVETEAYVGREDKACHGYGGRRTERNSAMYMRAGTCYVYKIYGMYECFNISSVEDGAGVLIRAVEPLCGISLMRRHRGGRVKDRDIANGPSKLCIAMGITRKEIDKEWIMSSSKIWIEEGMEVADTSVIVGKRIGIRNCGEWEEKELRFYIKDNEFVSCIRRKRGKQ
ncbi:3-methyladenine DNA glycosylase [Encephalitozoon romaleae SJ-2008]|uniref:DNA-3-methyladenine glycosylase II n=1 Tax=Encephalitozoon romaleae (strain SJ-2008) TaxID=1178016 RepID=I6ZW48_ENCRO|nr:3-methyladenine DNA glycosylase [Encephalitozoon romaleae SJ-2008]XP_009265483.1 3-methyladenine DNA glycosylase [Encephalitozoon romaleae SJ-2008]AFN83095.1 3-methyladenine DNA glycosylase [Encephalitozoon romaleae SJ-2008]AFN83986.1 3-methyladenine DNA glycosylase [Encephalitozoon romaleae SJ-2008]